MRERAAVVFILDSERGKRAKNGQVGSIGQQTSDSFWSEQQGDLYRGDGNNGMSSTPRRRAMRSAEGVREPEMPTPQATDL